MKPTLILPVQIWHQMAAHAVRELPNECLGMLVGLPNGRVQAAYEIVNAAAKPHRFISEPTSLFAAEKRRRADGWDLLGFYHSHPGGQPIPSSIDTDPEVNFWLDGNVITVIIAVEQTNMTGQSSTVCAMASDSLESIVGDHLLVARAYRLFPHRWEPVALRLFAK